MPYDSSRLATSHIHLLSEFFFYGHHPSDFIKELLLGRITDEPRCADKAMFLTPEAKKEYIRYLVELVDFVKIHIPLIARENEHSIATWVGHGGLVKAPDEIKILLKLDDSWGWRGQW